MRSDRIDDVFAVLANPRLSAYPPESFHTCQGKLFCSQMNLGNLDVNKSEH